MKHIALLLALITALALSAPGKAAEPAGASDPAKMIQTFYQWYITGLITNHNPMKNRAEMKRFVTDRLLNEIEKMIKGPEGLDGDYFVDSQEFDKQWAKNISVSKMKLRGTKATAELVLIGTEKVRKQLNLNLATEAGAWKIDQVEGVE